MIKYIVTIILQYNKMPADGKKNNDIDDLSDEYGRFISSIFDHLTRIFNTLDDVFDVLEKAFDDIPIFRPLVLLAIIGMLIYYVAFFQSFNGWNMLAFIYFFVGGIVLLFIAALNKFADLFEPYLLYRMATRKRREESKRILETHRIMRQIMKRKKEHKEISANDVLMPAKDKSNKI